MINTVWLFLIVTGVVVAMLRGTMGNVSVGIMAGVSSSVELFIGLMGIMGLWTGVMRVAEKSGLMEALSRGIRPVMGLLFPDVPKNHPAMGAIITNMVANMLGLGNAATPIGVNAMKELQKLNPQPDRATNAMCTFIVLNTSSVQLIPTTIIGFRAAAGSSDPTGIIGTALLATTASTLVGIIAVKVLQRLS